MKKFFNIVKDDKYDDSHYIKMALVNFITALRTTGSLLLIPITTSLGTFEAALATIAFFATDFVDGFLARKLHVQSFFGSLLDGLSDKLFGIICFLLLATMNPIFIIPILIEMGIIVVNLDSIDKGNNVQSSKLGKLKTGLLSLTVVSSFFCFSLPQVREALKFVNVASLNKILSMDPEILSTMIALPCIGAGLIVLFDYMNKSKEQTEAKKEEGEVKEESTIKEKLTSIRKEKQKLLEMKQSIMNNMKDKDEIIHDLFDTDFYIKNKDEPLLQLLKKTKGQ